MWYNKIKKDLSELPNMMEYHEKQLMSARAEINEKGQVSQVMLKIPGIMEYRYNQLQDVDAILEFLNLQLRIIKHKHYKKFFEGYGKALNSREAEKYSEAEDDVIDMETIINEVALIRNKWLGVIKIGRAHV